MRESNEIVPNNTSYSSVLLTAFESNHDGAPGRLIAEGPLPAMHVYIYPFTLLDPKTFNVWLSKLR